MNYRHPGKSELEKPAGGAHRLGFLWQELMLARPMVILLPAILTLLCLGAGLLYARLNYVQDDLAGAPLHTAPATVLRKTPYAHHTKDGQFYTTDFFQFRIAKYTVEREALEDEKTALTQVGSTVSLTYRIGKSGKYYVVDWQNPPVLVPISRSH